MHNTQKNACQEGKEFHELVKVKPQYLLNTISISHGYSNSMYTKIIMAYFTLVVCLTAV